MCIRDRSGGPSPLTCSFRASICSHSSVAGISSKRFSFPLTAAMLPVRPLGSTGVTPLPRYYGPLRLPARTVPSVIDSLGSFGVGCPSPPCRVSQVPRLIYSCALVPNHPGRSGECLLIASPPISGFIPSGGLATFTGVTRPNRVRLRYGSQVCFPGFHQPDYSDSLRFRYMHERAIYMVNSFQFTRSARLSLVYPMNADDKHMAFLFYRRTSAFIGGP